MNGITKHCLEDFFVRYFNRSLAKWWFSNILHMLNYGAPSGNCRRADKIMEFRRQMFCPQTPPGAMLQQPFRYRCSFMYVAVCDIKDIAEGIVLGKRKWLNGESRPQIPGLAIV